MSFFRGTSSSCYQTCSHLFPTNSAHQIRTIMNHTSHSTRPYVGKFNPSTRPKLPLPTTSPLAEPQIKVVESSQGIIPTVRRSAGGAFPVYVDMKHRGTAITTILRKIDGPAKPLYDLFKTKYPAFSEGLVYKSICNHLVFKGKVRQSLILVLTALEKGEELPSKSEMKIYVPDLTTLAARNKTERIVSNRRKDAETESEKFSNQSEQFEAGLTLAELRKEGLAPPLKSRQASHKSGRDARKPLKLTHYPPRQDARLTGRR